MATTLQTSYDFFLDKTIISALEVKILPFTMDDRPQASEVYITHGYVFHIYDLKYTMWSSSNNTKKMQDWMEGFFFYRLCRELNSILYVKLFSYFVVCCSLFCYPHTNSLQTRFGYRSASDWLLPPIYENSVEKGTAFSLILNSFFVWLCVCVAVEV